MPLSLDILDLNPETNTPKQYAILDVMLVDLSNHLKRETRSFQLVFEPRKYLLSEIVGQIKQKENAASTDFTLVDIDKGFRVRHVFKDIKN